MMCCVTGRKYAWITLCFLILGGCVDQGGGGERPCAAFNSIYADDWSTLETIGQTAAFTSNAGNRLSLTLASRADSKPYTGFDWIDDESVVCNMQSERLYTFDDGTTALMMKFGQVESFESTPEEQGLFLNIRTESPVGTLLGYGFIFNVSHPAAAYTDPHADTLHLTALTIDGQNYDSAVQQTYSDIDRITGLALADNAAITRVVVAKGAGLVEFELLNGEIFQRSGLVR